MLGGVAVLGLLTLISQGITAYGLETVFEAVIEELANQGKTKEQIIKEIEGYSIPWFIKNWIKDALLPRIKDINEPQASEESIDNLPVYFIEDIQPDFDKVHVLQKASTAFRDRIVLTNQNSSGVWIGTRVIYPEKVAVAFLDPQLKEDRKLFTTSSRSLSVGETYKVKNNETHENTKVQIDAKILNGYWLGAISNLNEESNDSKNNNSIVAVIYQA